MKLIRGPRIIQQLEETTYADLERETLHFIPRTKKRQFAVTPVQIQNIELVPFNQSGALEARATANSNGNTYQPIILFQGVEFQDEDTPENVTFTGTDGQEYHILPIQLRTTNVKVRCTCLDFRWRFSVQDQKADALYGEGPGLYQKVSNRPPNNPRNVPGICKHLMKLVVELRNSHLVTI